MRAARVHSQPRDLRRRVGERVEALRRVLHPARRLQPDRRRRERHDLRERSLHEGQPVPGLQLDVVAPEQQLGGAGGQLGVDAHRGRPRPAAGCWRSRRSTRVRAATVKLTGTSSGEVRIRTCRPAGTKPEAVDVEGEQRRRRVPVVEPGAEQHRVLAQREALAGRLDEGLVGDAVLVVAVHVAGPGEEVEQDALEARA